MNAGVGLAQIGQWYTRLDKGELFQVVDYDPDSRMIETQTFDGDLDEVDLETWMGLPLAFAEPPEDWTGPVDGVERDDLGYSETEMTGADWAEPLQSLRASGEDHEPDKEEWEEGAAEREPGSRCSDRKQRLHDREELFGLDGRSGWSRTHR